MSDDPWIAITAGQRGTGNGTVAYRVAANPDVRPRTGRMTIAGRTFTIEQTAGSSGTRLSISDVRLRESSGNAAATFAVTLSGVSASPVSVNYATANRTATRADYIAKGQTKLVFQPGQTTRTVTVNLKSDSLDEKEETFQVNLGDATNAAIADAQGIGTIVATTRRQRSRSPA